MRSVCGSGVGAAAESAGDAPAPLPAMHVESRRKFRGLKANYTSLYDNLILIDIMSFLITITIHC